MKRTCACNGVFLIMLVNMALAQSVAGLESLVDRLEHPLWTARRDAALAIAASGPAASNGRRRAWASAIRREATSHEPPYSQGSGQGGRRCI